MKRYSILFIMALLSVLACSDDESPTKKGVLDIDGDKYPMFKLFGQARLGSDYSYFEYAIANNNVKLVEGEPTGSNIDFVVISLYRNSASDEPITGTFTYTEDEIDDFIIALGYDSDTEDSDIFIDDFDEIVVTISKNGSTFTISGVATVDGVDISFSYKGKITMRPNVNDELPTRQSR